MRIIMYASIGVGVVIGLIYAGIYISTQIGIDTAERRGTAEEVENVEADGDRRLAVREEFRQLCATVASQQEEIENDEEALEDPAIDEETKSRIRLGIVGKRNTMEQNAEEYNSKAADEWSRGQFRAADLPEEIDTEEDVECGN